MAAFLARGAARLRGAIADPAAALDTLVTAYPETDRAVEERGLGAAVPVWTDGVPAFGAQTAERWAAYADWMKDARSDPRRPRRCRRLHDGAATRPVGDTVAVTSS